MLRITSTERELFKNSQGIAAPFLHLNDEAEWRIVQDTRVILVARSCTSDFFCTCCCFVCFSCSPTTSGFAFPQPRGLPFHDFCSLLSVFVSAFYVSLYTSPLERYTIGKNSVKPLYKLLIKLEMIAFGSGTKPSLNLLWIRWQSNMTSA